MDYSKVKSIGELLHAEGGIFERLERLNSPKSMLLSMSGRLELVNTELLNIMNDISTAIEQKPKEKQIKHYRINVSNWQGDSSALQVTNGEIVLQSAGKLEDTFGSKSEAESVMQSIQPSDTIELSIEEVKE